MVPKKESKKRSHIIIFWSYEATLSFGGIRFLVFILEDFLPRNAFVVTFEALFAQNKGNLSIANFKTVLLGLKLSEIHRTLFSVSTPNTFPFFLFEANLFIFMYVKRC